MEQTASPKPPDRPAPDREPSLVSVIVPTYNGGEAIREAVASVHANGPYNYEIIIVDNASGLETQAVLSDLEKVATVLHMEFNGGHNYAAKRGLARATGEMLVLLNDDALLAPDWISRAWRHLSRNPEIAIVGGTILSKDGSTIDFAGGRIDPWTGLTHHQLSGHPVEELQPLIGEIPEGRPTDYVCGASLAFRRDSYEVLAPWPEEYFMYYDDPDICTDARRLGYLVWYDPSMICYHDSRRTAGGETRKYFFWMHRSRLQFLLRLHGWKEWLACLRAELGAWRRGTYRSHAGTLLRAYAAVLFDLPRILRHRKEHFGRLHARGLRRG